MTPASFAKTNRNLQRAIARGDINTALNWILVMQGQIQMARALGDLVDQKPTKKRRYEKPKAALIAPPAPRLPVMLDPDGFSPGGAPNWYLNQRRLERAGLPLSHAPLTRADLLRQQAQQQTTHQTQPGKPSNVT